MNENHRDLIRLKLISQGLNGLYEMLDELNGLTLSERFSLRQPYAVGGQSILWLTHDMTLPSRPVLTRMALLPYHRAAYIKGSQILRVRQRIEHEAELLEQFQDTSLPNLYGLFHAHNPLQAPERGPQITENEPYLVMELINGPSVLERARSLHTRPPNRKPKRELSILAFHCAHSFVELCCALHQSDYLYTDLNPRNLVCSPSPDDWPVRVVDAGSIIPSSHTPDVTVPFSWAYVPSVYYEAYAAGHHLWPTPHYVMYTLGKTLWQVLTNRQPMPREEPDLQDETLLTYPKPLIRLVVELLQGHYQSFNQLKMTIEELWPMIT